MIKFKENELKPVISNELGYVGDKFVATLGDRYRGKLKVNGKEIEVYASDFVSEVSYVSSDGIPVIKRKWTLVEV